MKTAPIPSDESKIAGSRSATYEPSTGSRVSSARPAADSTSPTAATCRTPTRGANCAARPAEIITPAVNGRKASPAVKGP